VGGSADKKGSMVRVGGGGLRFRLVSSFFYFVDTIAGYST